MQSGRNHLSVVRELFIANFTYAEKRGTRKPVIAPSSEWQTPCISPMEVAYPQVCSALAQIDALITPRRNALGFRSGLSGGLLSRTMMLDELALVLAQTRPAATLHEIAAAITEENILGKPTTSSRIKSYRHLVELYGLDSGKALFRVLRKLAALDPASLPTIALVCVFCRDPQLRTSFGLIRTLSLGEHLPRERVETYLGSAFPERFSPASLKSIAQNTSASWTSAGHLLGRTKKYRSHPTARPIAVGYAMLAGYLAGLRGHRLLTSEFAELATAQLSLIPGMLSIASARGLLGFKQAGGVIELDFSPLLTPQELAFADVTD
jgi:hypothetical protein